MQTIEPPNELRRSRPRDVQLTGAGLAVVIVGTMLLVGAVVLIIFLSRLSARQAHDREALATSGEVTTAHVERLWRDSNDDKTPWVSYGFEIDGRQFSGRAKLGLSWWETLRTQAPLAIKYLPSNPARNVVVHAEPGVLPRWLPILLGLATATVGLLCIAAVQKQRRLLSEGRVAPATVTKIIKRHTSHGGTYRSIAFKFPSLSGTTVAGKSSTTRKGPDVGASLWVVYDPDNPKRSAIYPFQLVKVNR